MAKQCLYCGRPLAKDDARFCNDCGRSQVAPISTASGTAAPSPIKVKLPPKEYARDDPAAGPQETSLPGPAMGSTPVFPPPREQGVTPSSRLPKRPTRLKSQLPSGAVEKAKPAGAPLVSEVRPVDVVPASQPTLAEEASTMVLPNWREELAQLRKEQEQARADATVATEKKVERAAKEPPPLPRRSAGTFSSPSDGQQIAPPRQAPRTPLPSSEDERAFESPWQILPNTPQPQSSARPGPNPPLPPTENKPPTEASRRELHVKVWEPGTTVRSSPTQKEKPEFGPAPAIEQNPFASTAFDAEEQTIKGEELASITWQAPRGPLSASQKQPPAREEQHALVREEEEGQPPVREEQPLSAKDERQSPREESHQPVREEIRQPVADASGQQIVTENKDAIEDLPTAPLAVPEMAKQEPPIKIERASTPAPKQWTTPRTGNVEDLPTRPMAASASVSASPRSLQPPVAQTQSGAVRSNAELTEAASPFAQRGANAPDSSGAYGQAPIAQAAGQIAEADVDPLVSRARSTPATSQSGPAFDPTSLPPLPAGPLSAPGNARLRTEVPGVQGSPPRSAAPFPDAPGQHPPAFEASSASVLSSANVSKHSAGASAKKGEKPRKRRHTGRLIAVVLLVFVLVGGGVGVVFKRDWVTQYFQTPAQNQPYQTYQNSALGVSLAYTQGWSVNVDQAHSTVHFADSSHTGQVNLTTATASGQVNDYLNQQAAQLGITGPKTAPAATLGGASWLALQGTVTLSGATYTAVLYATQRNGHFYMLEFLAPQSSFLRIDQSNFAHMRSSFKFI